MKKSLHELITSTSWIKVENQLIEFYPEEDIDYFKQLYWKLFNITPLKNETNAELHLDLYDEENVESTEDLYYEVEYYNEIPDNLWALYLGFYISEESLSNIPSEEVICHILFEFMYGEIENFIQ